MRLDKIGEFFHQIQKARMSAHVLDILQESVFGSDVKGVFIATLPDFGEALTPHIIIKGWNAGWISYYDKHDYVHDDPIAKELLKTNLPFIWDRVCCARHLLPTEHQVMREAAMAGLKHGITVPVLDVGNKTTCVSFSMEHSHYDPEAIEYLRQIAFMSVGKLVTIEQANFSYKAKSGVRRNNMTPREIECITRVARGMASRQIAQELTISPRTVDQYIASAMQRLDASTRAEAVQKATKYRMINP